MEKTITVPLATYKRLCGCLLESQEILESLKVREFKKAPRLSKAQRTEQKLNRLLKEGKNKN